MQLNQTTEKSLKRWGLEQSVLLHVLITFKFSQQQPSNNSMPTVQNPCQQLTERFRKCTDIHTQIKSTRQMSPTIDALGVSHNCIIWATWNPLTSLSEGWATAQGSFSESGLLTPMIQHIKSIRLCFWCLNFWTPHSGGRWWTIQKNGRVEHPTWAPVTRAVQTYTLLLVSINWEAVLSFPVTKLNAISISMIFCISSDLRIGTLPSIQVIVKESLFGGGGRGKLVIQIKTSSVAILCAH